MTKELGTITLTYEEVVGFCHNRIANTIKDFDLYTNPTVTVRPGPDGLTIIVSVNNPIYQIEQASLL